MRFTRFLLFSLLAAIFLLSTTSLFLLPRNVAAQQQYGRIIRLVGGLRLIGGIRLGGTSGIASLNYGSEATSTATGPTVDYGTLTWGPGCTRVVLAIGAFDTTNPASTTVVTIGGTSAIDLSGAAAQATNGLSDIWETAPAGSSGDVQVTYSSPITGYGAISFVAAYCLMTASPTGNGTHNTAGFNNSVSKSISIPAGGVGLAIVEDGSDPDTFLWTNATQDAFDRFASAARPTESGVTFTVTATPMNPPEAMALSLAAWGP